MVTASGGGGAESNSSSALISQQSLVMSEAPDTSHRIMGSIERRATHDIFVFVASDHVDNVAANGQAKLTIAAKGKSCDNE